MRSLLIDRFGDPADVLQLADTEPREPGPGEVRIRLRARSINPSDLTMIRGRYGVLPELPAVPGFEGMGEVEAAGDGVDSALVGRRVVPIGARGTWQESLIHAADRVVPVPDGVGDEAAAQLVVNPMTAWVMVHEVLKVQPDQWLAQTAAGSTLGRIIIQLGQLRGFRTINIVRREEQAEELLEFGGDAAIDSSSESIRERIKAITGDEGVPAAIDAVGGEAGTELARSLGKGGTMLIIAALSGKPVEVSAGPMIFKRATVQGFWLTDWKQQVEFEVVEDVAAELFALMADGSLTPPVEATYDLGEFAQAIEHATRQGRSGKVLLVG